MALNDFHNEEEMHTMTALSKDQKQIAIIGGDLGANTRLDSAKLRYTNDHL